MRVHHVVADLELQVGQGFCLYVTQMLFRSLCDDVLLCPAGKRLPQAVCS